MYEPFRKGMPLNLGGILFSGTPQTPSLNIPGSIPSGRTYSGFLFQDEEGHTPCFYALTEGKIPRNRPEIQQKKERSCCLFQWRQALVLLKMRHKPFEKLKRREPIYFVMYFRNEIGSAGRRFDSMKHRTQPPMRRVLICPDTNHGVDK